MAGMDENHPIVQIFKQINELSGAALDSLLHGGGEGGQEHQGSEGGGRPQFGQRPEGGGAQGGRAPEGSPAEERSEPPAEARREGDFQRR
jgi:hypothetical protein